MNLELEHCLWMMPVCTLVTLTLTLTILAFGLCWWRIFKLTVRRFNKGERRRD